MRTIFLTLIILVLMSFAKSNDGREVNPYHKLKFEQDTLFFDTVMAGEKVNLSFKFRVITKDSVKIHQVYTGCSCTATDYPQDSMGPNSQHQINIVFDSKDWGGNFVNKHLYVLYNGASQTVFFKGYVKPAAPIILDKSHH